MSLERLRRARVATAAMFLVSGATIGVWAANVPYVRDRLDASTTTLGLCLLAMAAGSVLAMPLTGRELQRRSSRSMTRLGALLVPLAGLPPLLAPSVATLALALFVLGVVIGLLDVSMNAHGVAVEQAIERPVMSSLHGGWSLGGLSGAGCVALGHALGIDPRVTAAVVLALLVGVGLAAGRSMGELTTGGADDRVAPGAPDVRSSASSSSERAAGFVVPSRAVALLGALVFALFMAEGALTDWSALYLDRDLGTDHSLAALGYGLFSGGMAAGRLGGDRLNALLGPARLLRGGTLLAAASMAVMLAAGTAAVALPALLLFGLGVANGVPLLFSAAGRARDMEAGPAIAAVSTAGYLGLLGGPPLLGFLADATSLPAALSIAALLTGLVALAAGRAER